MQKIKLIIADIDGVLSNGKKIYDVGGGVLGKEFQDKDFTAIEKFKENGVKFCFLSSDKEVNKAMAYKRGIDFWYSRNNDGSINKKRFIPEFEKCYDVLPEEMVYIGDDYYDLDIINNLKYTFCPSDSPIDVKNSVYKVLNGRGGECLILELFEYLKFAGLI